MINSQQVSYNRACKQSIIKRNNLAEKEIHSFKIDNNVNRGDELESPAPRRLQSSIPRGEVHSEAWQALELVATSPLPSTRAAPAMHGHRDRTHFCILLSPARLRIPIWIPRQAATTGRTSRCFLQLTDRCEFRSLRAWAWGWGSGCRGGCCRLRQTAARVAAEAVADCCDGRGGIRREPSGRQAHPARRQSDCGGQFVHGTEGECDAPLW